MTLSALVQNELEHRDAVACWRRAQAHLLAWYAADDMRDDGSCMEGVERAENAENRAWERVEYTRSVLRHGPLASAHLDAFHGIAV